MRCLHALKSAKSLKKTLLAASVCLLLAGSARAAVIISEVAPWSSGNSPIAHDWFELTNTGVAPVNIAGWTVDDGSADFSLSAPLSGIASIGAGESVIFVEDDGSAFKSTWFGAPNVPASLQIGTYTGGGLGLSSGGDGVTIFNGVGAQQAIVTFGASPAGPFPTFDNAAGLSGAISQLSVVGVNGAFNAAADTNEIGSPGTIKNVPEPASVLLFVLGAGALTMVQKRRHVRS